MASVTKTFQKSKETKTTVVYENKDADSAIGVVYIKKSFLGEPIAETVEITVKA